MSARRRLPSRLGCAPGAGLQSLGSRTDSQSTTILHRVSWAMLWPSRDALQKLGKALCRGDGRNEPPGRAQVGDWQPTTAGRVPPDEPEFSQLLANAQSELQRLIEVLDY